MNDKPQYVFLFDVNHTLINTALYHTKALLEIEKNLSKYIDLTAARYITRRFDEIFLLMVAGFLFRTVDEWKKIPGRRKSYERLVDLITEHQVKVKGEWGFIKKWSREVFLKIAADEIKAILSPEVIQNTATIYWDTITNLTEPFDEAKKLHDYLTDKGYHIYLLTSSDGRLQIKKGFFTYDPLFSGTYKKNRMITLKKKGLHFRDVIVGDPHDKPFPDYYKRAIEIVSNDLKKEIQNKNLIIVGNSLEDDLETPNILLGFGTGFLFKKGTSSKRIHENIFEIGNLMEVVSIMKI